MTIVTSIAALEALYPAAAAASVEKVAHRLTPCYTKWIEAARFAVLTTVGPEGTDGSPRGDTDPVVRIADATTLHLPDWRGNNRLDSLRNIVADGRVSLMFMVPGCENVVRVNGRAQLDTDPALTASFARAGRQPTCVIVIQIEDVYFQCAKALMRSALWSPDSTDTDLPSAGDFIKEFKEYFDSAGYDLGYATYAKERMW